MEPPPTSSRAARSASRRPPPSSDRTARPASVSLQTSQSGLIGLRIHGAAQPWRMQLRIVCGLTVWPFSSNRGSLPPGWSRPRASHRLCAALGRNRRTPDVAAGAAGGVADVTACPANRAAPVPRLVILSSLTRHGSAAGPVSPPRDARRPPAPFFRSAFGRPGGCSMGFCLPAGRMLASCHGLPRGRKISRPPRKSGQGRNDKRANEPMSSRKPCETRAHPTRRPA